MAPRWICFLIACFCCLAAKAQDSLRLRWQKPGPVAAAYPDHFGNLWLLDAQNKLVKFNWQGDSVAVYNAIARHGILHQLSLTNPLQVVLFYKDFQTIVLLDRLLAPRLNLPLSRASLFQVKTATLSYDANLWVYDELEHKIIKLSEAGERLLETSDLRQLLAHEFSPQWLWDQDGALYAYDAAYGWVVFDYYGAAQRSLPYPGWQQPDAFRGTLSGWEKGRFISVSLKDLFPRYPITALPADCQTPQWQDGWLFCVDAAGGLRVYSR